MLRHRVQKVMSWSNIILHHPELYSPKDTNGSKWHAILQIIYVYDINILAR